MNKIFRTFAIIMGCVALPLSAWAADTHTLNVSAQVVGTCKFVSASSSLAFGALDPSSGANPTAIGSTTFWCTKGSSYAITDNNGLNWNGTSRQMIAASGSGDLIPYALSYNPTNGTGNGPSLPITLNFSGLIQNADYIDKTADSYADTVTVTINP